MLFPEAKDFDDERQLLIGFVEAYQKHIFTILRFEQAENYRMPWISEDLRDILGEEGKKQIEEDFSDLIAALRQASDGELLRHGLIGPQLKFKLAYINHLEGQLYQNNIFVFQRLFGKSLGDIVDTVIDSAIDATGAGVGIKEIGDVASDVIGQAVDDE